MATPTPTKNCDLSFRLKKITKEAEPNILKLCAQETVNSYSRSAIHAYTDGSAFKATINAGFGILLKYPDGSSSEYSDSCGINCSNYEARDGHRGRKKILK